MKSKIYVAGHTGLVGSALMRALQLRGYENVVTRMRHELDLTHQTQVMKFFMKERPEYVFLAAGKVGGICANDMYPADFILENLQIQVNTFSAAKVCGVKKLLFLGSNCMYPRLSPQPMKESYLLSGQLEPTNEPYAVAKIAGVSMCQNFNRQYGANFIAAVPASIYGPHDDFSQEDGHVMASIIRRFYEAKQANVSEVMLWGSGSPRREFLFAYDAADALIFLMEAFDPTPQERGEGEVFVNVGTSVEISIVELARTVARIVGYNGKITFDLSKPDGMPRKVLDSTRIEKLGWKPGTSLEAGIRHTYDWYRAQFGK